MDLTHPPHEPTTRRSRRLQHPPTIPSGEQSTAASDDSDPTGTPVVVKDGVLRTRREARTRQQQTDDPTHDAFVAAARLFSFTEQSAGTNPDDHHLPTASATTSPVPTPVMLPTSPVREHRIRRLAAAGFTGSVLGIVALMTVGMTTPAEALPHEHSAPTAAAAAGDVLDGSSDVQAYVTPSATESVDLSRSENYSVASLVNRAGTVGISNFSDAVFVNDPSCAIQWPYAVGVPITYGFGMRDGRMHEGTDFVPGAGAQIQAITDGVVRASTDSGGAYGVMIVIDHVVDGQAISTRYAHMEYDSRQVQVGDTVSVGEYIGRTGNTGRSFGAHLHFELLQNGAAAIDPLPWLREHAIC